MTSGNGVGSCVDDPVIATSPSDTQTDRQTDRQINGSRSELAPRDAPLGLLAPRLASASRAPATLRGRGIGWHGIVCRDGGMRKWSSENGFNVWGRREGNSSRSGNGVESCVGRRVFRKCLERGGRKRGVGKTRGGRRRGRRGARDRGREH